MTLTTRQPLERRTSLERRTGLRVRTAGLPSRRIREQRRADRPGLDIPQEARAVVRRRSGGRCEAALEAAACAGTASDVHHRQRRRDGGHAIANLLDLCRACHSWAHANPAAARHLGLIVSVYDDPATAPVLMPSALVGARVWTVLTEDGERIVAPVAPW